MAAALFPPWSTSAFRAALAVAALAAVGIPCLLMAWVRTGFVTGQGEPLPQPVAFDHRHHVVDDGIDCRYCHWPAERGAWAGAPPTSVCMNCHAQIWKDSAALAPVRASFASGEPIRWNRVNALPQFVYFDHSAHVSHGVGCVSCHGHVERMARVEQGQPLTMAWCLDCHRHPERALRPLDRITDMEWTPQGESQEQLGTRLVKALGVQPPLTCSGCHR